MSNIFPFKLLKLLKMLLSSGRSYTLRGGETQKDRGLMIRACEDLLSMMAISKESIRSRKAIVGGVFYNLGV